MENDNLKIKEKYTNQEGSIGSGDSAMGFDEGGFEFGELLRSGHADAVVLVYYAIFTVHC